MYLANVEYIVNSSIWSMLGLAVGYFVGRYARFTQEEKRHDDS